MDQNNTHPELSIVCTIYNDATIVPLLVNEIKTHTDGLTIPYEIILVNDASTDQSEASIMEICCSQENVKGISLSRNFGQQIAMSAGIRYATGQYVLIMDGDLQNPPSEIPHLYHEILKGYDVVYTVSETRNNLLDQFTSRVFWLLITKLMGVKIVQNQLMMKIMNRNFADRFNSYSEINRTVAAIVRDISSNHTVIPVKNRIRGIGASHYSFQKRINLLIDILISMSNAPLNLMIYFGLLTFFTTLVLSLYHVIRYICYDVPAGYGAVLLSICFFGSLTILLLGFIGRYLSSIYTEVRRRPLYHVKSLFNIKNPIK